MWLCGKDPDSVDCRSMQELKGIPIRTKYESIVYETKYAEET